MDIWNIGHTQKYCYKRPIYIRQGQTGHANKECQNRQRFHQNVLYVQDLPQKTVQAVE